MKLGWFVGFGVGMAAGALLLNNCKRARKTVSDAQETVVRKMDEKTKESCEAARFEEFTGNGADTDKYMSPADDAGADHNAEFASDSAYAAQSNTDG